MKNVILLLFLTSHDMDDISSVCDELIVIDKGKIILQESMDVILSKFSDFKLFKDKNDIRFGTRVMLC